MRNIRVLAVWVIPLLIGTMVSHMSALDSPEGAARDDVIYENCCFDVVYMTLRRFGRTVPLESLREQCPSQANARGITIEEMKALVDLCDLSYREVAGGANQITECLGDGGVMLATLEDKMHVVAHVASKDGMVLMYDPPHIVRWIAVADLKYYWDGYGIAVFPDKSSLGNSGHARLLNLAPYALIYGVAAALLVLGAYLVISGRRRACRR